MSHDISRAKQNYTLKSLKIGAQHFWKTAFQLLYSGNRIISKLLPKRLWQYVLDQYVLCTLRGDILTEDVGTVNQSLVGNPCFYDPMLEWINLQARTITHFFLTDMVKYK